ncbi:MULTISPECIES: zinc-binding alcohol dehydrogenase [unclassified Pannonibacter]|uniref:zinc-dependent alcohol dehydrogenase n=1 Tax=unclassified Pannonibacter TaxID=2627228 RepID=UPI001645685D|nr:MULTISPECIES: zinc-binding alcohol dehydrogenase [unclassified Pannonibacter]
MTADENAGNGQRAATALWYVASGACELRREQLALLEPGRARLRTLASGVSRGTERLVLSGLVPEAEWQRMRAPLQEGDFPYPVKYGYAAVGRVEAGPPELLGQTVFCLHPHQDLFDAPLEMLVPVPQVIPAERVILAANMETALNALWDGAPAPGDHICVVGGGVLGLLCVFLAAGIPGTRVTLVDIDPSRAEIAASFGAGFALPTEAPGDQDLVIHASASPEGLATALTCAGDEATVLELSWYGAKPVSVPLGADFHSRRLVLKSTQVGRIPAQRRNRWTFRRRLETALSLLADDRLDALLYPRLAFSSLPERLPHVLLHDRSALAPLVVYDQPE